MKGVHGLILAAGLGIAAAIFNFAYLNMKSKDLGQVHFIGINPDKPLSPAQRLTKEHLVPVPIPAGWSRDLDKYVVPWKDRQTVIGASVPRKIDGGTLLLQDDLKTPPQQLAFGQNYTAGPGPQAGQSSERAMFIPVDPKSFIPRLVIPGDYVSFLVSKASRSLPTPVAPPNPGNPPSANPPTDSAQTEIIGPFRVLSLGNRLGTAEVLRAAKIPQVQENVMTISVEVDGSGNLEPRAQKLWNLLKETNFRQAGILLHPRKTKK